MLLARLFASLPLVCPNCGADMRIIAFITDAAPVAQILIHIGDRLGRQPKHRVRDRHGRVHAEAASLVRAGSDDPVRTRLGTDHHRPTAPFGMVALLDRRVEGVEIDM